MPIIAAVVGLAAGAGAAALGASVVTAVVVAAVAGGVVAAIRGDSILNGALMGGLGGFAGSSLVTSFMAPAVDEAGIAAAEASVNSSPALAEGYAGTTAGVAASTPSVATTGVASGLAGGKVAEFGALKQSLLDQGSQLQKVTPGLGESLLEKGTSFFGKMSPAEKLGVTAAVLSNLNKGPSDEELALLNAQKNKVEADTFKGTSRTMPLPPSLVGNNSTDSLVNPQLSFIKRQTV